jgi:hypothetical protein
MSLARDALLPVRVRTVPLRQRERVSGTGQVSQIFIDGSEFLIIHSSERTPWHLFSELRVAENVPDSMASGCRRQQASETS